MNIVGAYCQVFLKHGESKEFSLVRERLVIGRVIIHIPQRTVAYNSSSCHRSHRAWWPVKCSYKLPPYWISQGPQSMKAWIFRMFVSIQSFHDTCWVLLSAHKGRQSLSTRTTLCLTSDHHVVHIKHIASNQDHHCRVRHMSLACCTCIRY